jgi:hypothetical protein
MVIFPDLIPKVFLLIIMRYGTAMLSASSTFEERHCRRQRTRMHQKLWLYLTHLYTALLYHHVRSLHNLRSLPGQELSQSWKQLSDILKVRRLSKWRLGLMSPFFPMYSIPVPLGSFELDFQMISRCYYFFYLCQLYNLY